MNMDAKIKALWLIVECPHCSAPQTKCRVMHNNSTMAKPFSMECDMCLKVFVVTPKVNDESFHSR